MAFVPASPLILNGMLKFLSFVYHRYVGAAIFTLPNFRVDDRLANAKYSQGLTNSQVLYRVLRSCADVGAVERMKSTDDAGHERFTLTSSGIMLTSNHPLHARDLLPDLVRDQNMDINKIRDGMDFFTYICQLDNQELLTTFDGSMSALFAYTNEKLATAVDFGQFATLVDVGGDRGTFLTQILQHHDKIQSGIVFDLPQVIAIASNTNEVSCATWLWR